MCRTDVNARHRILELGAQLIDRDSRSHAADALAHELGSSALLIFVRDEEVDRYLIAPGLPQTLPNERAWRSFLQETAQSGRHTAELSVGASSEGVTVDGYAVSPDVVIALIGRRQPSEAFDEFLQLLPILAAGLRGEHLALVAKTKAELAEESALKLQAANDQLQRARAAADQANRAKSEFLTTMSHELRTPLNAISGYVQLLQIGVHGSLSDSQQDALTRVMRSQRHLLRLINDILSLARIEAGGVDYRITDVDLKDAVDELTPLVEPQLGDKQLTLSTQFLEQDISVRADRDKVEQILLNLLSNAVKFTGDGGHITVVAGRELSETQFGFVEVKDTGRGIPADKLDSIFEAFVQVHSGLTRTHEGTGLGLAISRDLARGMNGELTVESEVGRGSTFRLRLPLAVRSRQPRRFPHVDSAFAARQTGFSESNR